MLRYCFLIGTVWIFMFGSAKTQEMGSADLNGDGVVDIMDWNIFVAQWGAVRGDDNFVEDLRASDVLPILMALKKEIEYSIVMAQADFIVLEQNKHPPQFEHHGPYEVVRVRINPRSLSEKLQGDLQKYPSRAWQFYVLSVDFDSGGKYWLTRHIYTLHENHESENPTFSFFLEIKNLAGYNYVGDRGQIYFFWRKRMYQ